MGKICQVFGGLILLGAAGASDTGASVPAVLIGVAVALLMICLGVVVGKAQKKILKSEATDLRIADKKKLIDYSNNTISQK